MVVAVWSRRLPADNKSVPQVHVKKFSEKRENKEKAQPHPKENGKKIFFFNTSVLPDCVNCVFQLAQMRFPARPIPCFSSFSSESFNQRERNQHRNTDKFSNENASRKRKKNCTEVHPLSKLKPKGKFTIFKEGTVNREKRQFQGFAAGNA